MTDRSSQTSKDALERAMTLAAGGNNAEALRAVQEYLLTQPRDREAMNNAGVLLFRLGRIGEAIRHFRAALACPTGEAAGVLVNMAEAHLVDGDPAAAMALMPQMLQANALSPELANRTADAMLGRTDIPAALEALGWSLAACPNQRPLEDILKRIGAILKTMAAGDQAAGSLLKRAEQLEHNGSLLQAAGVYEAIGRQMNDPQLIFRAALLLYRDGSRDQRALDLCGELNAAKPSPASLLLEARLHRRGDRIEQAIHLLEQAEEMTRA